MRYVTHMNVSSHTYRLTRHTLERGIPHAAEHSVLMGAHVSCKPVRGPKLGTYSDWGLSSVLVINKHLSHHHKPVLSRTPASHATYIKESRCTHEGVMSHSSTFRWEPLGAQTLPGNIYVCRTLSSVYISGFLKCIYILLF